MDSESWVSEPEYQAIGEEAPVEKNKRWLKRFCWVLIPVLAVTCFLVFMLVLPGKVGVTPVYMLYNGTVYTMDPDHTSAYNSYLDSGEVVTPYTAFVVGSDGNFYDIGTQNMLVKEEYSRLPKIDLHGSIVFPGFIDAHLHLMGIGLLEKEVDLSSSTSEANAVQMVVENAKSKGIDVHKDAGYFFVGGRWDQNRWEGKQFPTAKALDEFFPDMPVILNRIDYHALWVNTAAMRAIGGIPVDDPEGGYIARDEFGDPTGVFVDNAMNMFLTSAYATYPEHIRHEAMRISMQKCSKYGITSVHDASLLDTDFDMMKKEISKGRNINGATDQFPLRVVGMLDVLHVCKLTETSVQCPSRFPIRDVYSGKLGHFRHLPRHIPVKHRFLTLPHILDGVTTRISMPAAKLVLDGALGSRGARLMQPYTDDPQNYGLEQYPSTQLTNIITTQAQKGFQVCTHAIGDFAVQQAIQNIKNIIFRGIGDGWSGRHRIEHQQIATGSDLETLRNSGIVPSMQPTHATSDMLFAEDRLGKARLEHAYAWREALDLTGAMAFGTDAPIEEINPFRTLHSAVSMQDENDSPNGGWLPSHVVSRYQAITAMTWGAAYAARQDHILGSITKGKTADFIILDSDIMKMHVENIVKTSVRATFIDGNAVYISEEEMRWAGEKNAFYAMNYNPESVFVNEEHPKHDELAYHRKHSHESVPVHLQPKNKGFANPLKTSPCLAQTSFLDFMYRKNKQNKL